MRMTYRFGNGFCLTDVAFDGLTGREYVTSTKEALNLMKIKSPALDFSADVREGIYDDVLDEEYEEIVETIRFVKDLWRYPEDPEDVIQTEMNVLTLLANAMEVISRQYVQLKSRQEEK